MKLLATPVLVSLRKGVFQSHVSSGIPDYYAVHHEVWLQIRGLNQNWCKWPALMQFVTSFGIIVDVNWYGMFRTSTKLSGSRSSAYIIVGSLQQEF
jgi:hypothetical protein